MISHLWKDSETVEIIKSHLEAAYSVLCVLLSMQISDVVYDSVRQLFKEDKSGEITLEVNAAFCLSSKQYKLRNVFVACCIFTVKILNIGTCVSEQTV